MVKSQSDSDCTERSQIANLSCIQKRKLYEVCWQFEDAWRFDSSTALEPWVSKVDGVAPEIVRQELSETLQELDSGFNNRQQFTKLDTVRYEFVEEIAQGGAAVIWRVVDRQLERQSAIKFLMDSQDNSGMRERLRREARICAQLVHPWIVPIHELSSFEDGRPFVCMKLIEGKTLLQLLLSSPPISMDKALEIFSKACQAMAFAHEKGIIHRDLSPSNIMVGLFGEVQIMDWGLAKDFGSQESSNNSSDFAADDAEITARQPSLGDSGSPHDGQNLEKTLTGTIFGTLAYMSPEQASGQVDRIDKRSDVFALGAILCRILTGSAPYLETDQKQLLSDVQNGNLQDTIQRLCKVKNSWFSNLAIRCLATDPNLRPADAAALVVELEKIQVSVRRRTLALRYLVLAGIAICFLPPIASMFTRDQGKPKQLTPDAPLFEKVTDPTAIQSLLDAGNIDLVLRSYQSALDKNSTNMGLHYVICVALIRKGRYEEAETVANKLISLDSNYGHHYHLLGEILYPQGRFDEALKAEEKAISITDATDQLYPQIEKRIDKLHRSIELSTRIAASKNPAGPSCLPSEYRELADVFDLQNRPDLAIRYYKLWLNEISEPAEHSKERYDILVKFVGLRLSQDTVSVHQRNEICKVGLEWAEQEFEWAKTETQTEGKPLNEEILKQKRLLMSALKYNDGMDFARAAKTDSRIEPALQKRLNALLNAIAEAK